MITTHYEIQRKTAHGWTRWDTPNDRADAHELLCRAGRDWPTDTFRIAFVITDELERVVNGSLVTPTP